MPDRWLRLARALLPRAAARDWFDPSWCDLRIEHLTRLARARSEADRRWNRVCHAARTVLLLLDCWRLLLIEGSNRPRPSKVGAKRPPRERRAMLLYQLRHAVRRLVREPGFTAAAVITLALGVGANVAVFAVVEATLFRPLPYPDADDLVIVRHRDQRTGIAKDFIAIGDYVDLAARRSSLEALGAYGPRR